ncbi:MAG: dTMP kinase [Alphaproteobacteria bacterium]|nr:MAG: dTMP kinase [Alphaproteobacteria bacterium]
MRGRFITFEGGEGAGKSTQALLLAERLRSLGFGVVVSREPGGSPGAEVIRHVLLSGAAKPLGLHAEAILLAAARADHVSQTILPALECGEWVISERFSDAARLSHGASAAQARLLAQLEKTTLGELKPDLTIILDLAPAQGMVRVKRAQREEPADAETLDLASKHRKAMQELAEREPQRCAVVNAGADAGTVAEFVWAVVNSRLLAAEAPARLRSAAS